MITTKPQSIIDTHRAVLALAQREALEVTIEDNLRGTVQQVGDTEVLLHVRLIHEGREYAAPRRTRVTIGHIDRLTLHA